MSTSTSEVLLATQRDLRRYKTFRADLSRSKEVPYHDLSMDITSEHDALLPTAPQPARPPQAELRQESTIVEAMPWAAIAYDSFVWWATAGESTGDVTEEARHDEELFRVADRISSTPGTHEPSRLRSRPGASGDAPDADVDHEEGEADAEIKTVVAYFHHMTSELFGTLADLVDEQAGSSDADRVVRVTRDDLVALGLDVWSPRDRDFVKAVLGTWFAVEGIVEGASVECCGLKLY